MDSVVFIACVLAVLFAAELIFRVLYRLRHGKPYHVSLKFPWKRSYVVPHPFLSFSYKRNEVIDRNQRLPYALHPNKYYSFKKPLRLNNYGHFGEDFHLEKPERTLRVACLGASTTANNIADTESDYTYPGFFRNFLSDGLRQSGLDVNVEVMNCGIGGWVSADIMINFFLNIIHLKPDYVVLYHGYNDLHLHLMDGFRSDYSHGRMNLGEVIERIRLASRLPKFRWWHSYECLKDRVFGTGNVRNDVLRMILKQSPNPHQPFADIAVEQQNFRNLLAVCRHHGIRVLLSSFCYFDHDASPVAIRHREGVAQENAMMRELAEEFGLPFVDQAAMMPNDAECFVDSVHFSPSGMSVLARNFADALVADVAANGLPDGSGRAVSSVRFQ